MSRFFLFLILLFSQFFFGQVWELEYSFFVKNSMSGKIVEFPSKLFVNDKGNSIYTVNFGLPESNTTLNGDNVIYRSKEKYNYLLYSNNKIFLINDNIAENNYLLKDNAPNMLWVITNETKLSDNVELTKAKIQFRGRDYVAWFNPLIKVNVGPWKFTNTPGLIYEVYDSNDSFRWVLINKRNISTESIKNPFSDIESKFVDYKEYPKLRYGLSPQLEKDLRANPYNQIVELERNDLEIKFEWEK